VVTIGAIIPFLAVLTDPVGLLSNPIVESIARSFQITAPEDLIVPISMMFGLAAITSGSIRFALLYFSAKISFAIGHDLSVGMYRRTLYQDYSTHIERNSSEVINAVAVKCTLVIFGIVMPLLTLFNSVIMLTVVMIFLISIDPFMALILSLGFILIYAVIVKFSSKRLKEAGETIAVNSTLVLKSMQEGLGEIRDILINGSQEEYSKMYKTLDAELRSSQKRSQVIREAPRYIVESLGLVLIAWVAFEASGNATGVAGTLPILGALALGCQRMLPVVQQGYASWGTIRGSIPSLVDVVDLLDQPIKAHQLTKLKPISFEKCLSFREVSFRYSPDSPMVLKNINFDIARGSRVGILGPTGGGKSSLLDILMGLLKPVDGFISIDKVILNSENIRSWQRNIGHVPQTIFLSDASISENIAFGVPISEINHQLVRKSAEKAQLADTIESWNERYKTRVGERGVRLSGGQRQRIGIARALYKNTKVIILDEATSALDNDTEASVIRSIEELGDDLTIIMVAHRVSTLKDCDQIFEIKNSQIRVTKSIKTKSELL
jgi:ATP-binding cassette subfamily B protein